MFSRLRPFLIGLNALLAGAALLAYLSPFIDPSRIWICYLPALFLVPVWGGLLLFLLGWAVRKDPAAFISLFVILGGMGYFGDFWGLSCSRPAPADGELTILSYNTRAAYKFRGNQPEKEMQAFFDLLTREQADVYLLQEFRLAEPVLGRIRDLFREQDAGFQFYAPERSGLFVASRFPIVGQGTLPLPEDSNAAVFVDLEIRGKQVRVFNVHLYSNHISNKTDRLSRDPDISDEEFLQTLRSIMSNVRSASRKRVSQAVRLKAAMEASDRPVIMAGDLNEVPNSFILELLTTGMQDAFREKGRGPGGTYNESRIPLRIDYLLAGPEFRITGFDLVRENRFSDHYPIRISLLPEK